MNMKEAAPVVVIVGGEMEGDGYEGGDIGDGVG
jgi:hypothetical protein